MHVASTTKSTSRIGGRSRATVRHDARSARATRTRTAIADAMLALIREGVTTPTATDIARRAGTGVRTVFAHFGHMEDLYAEIIRRIEPQVAGLILPVDARLDLADRVQAMVAQRFAINELTAPIRRAMRVSDHARLSPAIRDASRRLEYVLSRHASETFAAELHNQPDRYGVLERIAVHTSFEVWDHFVRIQRLPIARARRHIVVTVLREFSDRLA